MSDVESIVRDLQERVARLEDQVALYQLMMSYGPSVDSGSSDFAAGLWTDDGVYDFDNVSDVLAGAPAIKAMVEGPRHHRRHEAAQFPGLARQPRRQEG